VFIHKTAIVDRDEDGLLDCEIGDGTKIWAFSHVSRGAKIGKDCVIGEGVHIGPGVVIGDRVKIQNGAILYKGVTVEDEVFIGPRVVTTNDIYPRAVGEWGDRFRETHIKKGASVGANATIVCGVTLEEGCMVGAGSVVTKDVPRDALVYGNPARMKK
jgi:acetyltransferase-like isoleucine patch superfamily enzyme